jgi:hypothetical protein
MRFRALQDFFSEELKSHYCRDLSYQARSDDAKLISLLPDWTKEGKIELVNGGSKIFGTAEVKG